MIELLILLMYEWANTELDEKQLEYWDEQERERRAEKEAVVKKERWLPLETSVAVYTIFHPRIQMSQTGGVRSLSNSDGQSDGSQVIQQMMCYSLAKFNGLCWIHDMGHSLHFTD